MSTGLLVIFSIGAGCGGAACVGVFALQDWMFKQNRERRQREWDLSDRLFDVERWAILHGFEMTPRSGRTQNVVEIERIRKGAGVGERV